MLRRLDLGAKRPRPFWSGERQDLPKEIAFNPRQGSTTGSTATASPWTRSCCCFNRASRLHRSRLAGSATVGKSSPLPDLGCLDLIRNPRGTRAGRRVECRHPDHDLSPPARVQRLRRHRLPRRDQLERADRRAPRPPAASALAAARGPLAPLLRRRRDRDRHRPRLGAVAREKPSSRDPTPAGRGDRAAAALHAGPALSAVLRRREAGAERHPERARRVTERPRARRGPGPRRARAVLDRPEAAPDLLSAASRPFELTTEAPRHARSKTLRTRNGEATRSTRR